MRHEVRIGIAADHPAFAGHFPGAPVLPGALLVSLVLNAVPAGRLAPPLQIDQVKFLAPVRPGTELLITLDLDAGTGLPFEVTLADGSVVARGRVSPLR